MVEPTPHADAAPSLLGAGDPPPYRVYQAQGRSPYLLIADHAGRQVPRALADLGLPQHELDRHIGWDIGIAGVTRALAQALDAFAIMQTYSRLVIDCNRPLAAPGSIAEASDGTVVPGNQGLDAAARAARAGAIFAPYHARIGAELDRRRDAGTATILIAMHSFTPALAGVARPWHAGVLYQRDARFAQALLAELRAQPGLVIGDNQPYSVSDATDYAIPVHAEARGLAHVELEIRQDLIAASAGQRQWAQRLLSMLTRLQAAFTPG
ncbi:N-formylglutamate amidohydrolase [Xanthomonas theicola]|uniref:N-formylglutamate amidohydrolase n=1 Tax=Xanthomonas theicola TaxID=56464 RepID=A0A2S6ZED9_9XANT|nr:N-formylglutamate amidohydrolase [Xanthomonas theicola]PPT90638.1 N-formylglutamate amidohydrolase [Xanthomonas theicola]QNH26875.1 N-formylglutamate amidohydrolase [Xanthomonas theicola]